jgi:putative intracellular protease/amidase
MANEKLIKVKGAVLVEDGFEQIELLEPREALDQAGAQTSIVSPRRPEVPKDVAKEPVHLLRKPPHEAEGALRPWR